VSRSRDPLSGAIRAVGWTLTAYDDAPHRFFAVACRTPDAG
jgi:hypothetical protein